MLPIRHTFGACCALGYFRFPLFRQVLACAFSNTARVWSLSCLGRCTPGVESDGFRAFLITYVWGLLRLGPPLFSSVKQVLAFFLTKQAGLLR